jgi:hypothetical protein
VKINVNYNQKTMITAIATITADPTHPKLPLTLLAKGKTEKCEQQLGEHAFKEYYTLHSESGWSNTSVMLNYLTILREYYDSTFAKKTNFTPGETQIDLIWDCFAAHRNQTVRDFAAELKINLHFVPAGATDQYQPLDVKVFGALKSKARKMWNERYVIDPTSPKIRNQPATYCCNVGVIWIPPQSKLRGQFFTKKIFKQTNKSVYQKKS